MLRANEPALVQGRYVTETDVAQIRQWIQDHPGWSRRRLSQVVATEWNWRNGAGQLKDMAARSLWVKLDQRRWIPLPPRGWKPKR